MALGRLMELYGVRIFVDDLERAFDFYGRVLGLPVAWDGGDAVGFQAGRGVLIVEHEDPAGPEGHLVGRFLGVSLEVPDIEATHRALAAAGVAFEAPPQRMAWGGRLAHFRDPAGNVLTLLG